MSLLNIEIAIDLDVSLAQDSVVIQGHCTEAILTGCDRDIEMPFPAVERIMQFTRITSAINLGCFIPITKELAAVFVLSQQRDMVKAL